MPRITPLPESEATEKVEQTYGRIREMLESDSLPEPFRVYGRVPAFLQDFYMNFKKFVYGEGQLDARTRTLIALAVSTRDNCGPWADYFTRRAATLGISAEQIAETIAVASTNAMYNAFFKFRALSGSDLFSGLPVGLRAHTFSGTSLDDRTVELLNVAISGLNACQPCVSGHVEKSRRLGLSDEAILEAVQCTATMAAGIAFLKAAGY
jgi:alkyl hydroperoxide reductase subunit D